MSEYSQDIEDGFASFDMMMWSNNSDNSAGNVSIKEILSHFIEEIYHVKKYKIFLFPDLKAYRIKYLSTWHT